MAACIVLCLALTHFDLKRSSQPTPQAAAEPPLEVVHFARNRARHDDSLDAGIADTGVLHRRLLRADKIVTAPGFAQQVCAWDRRVDAQLRADARRPSHGARARIGVLTYFAGVSDRAEARTLLCEGQWNHLQYARRHGYDLLWDGPGDIPPDGNRTGHWNKLVSIDRWLPHYDWVLWVDADALFLNQEIRLEDVIREAERAVVNRGLKAEDIGLVISQQNNFPNGFAMYNSGVMLLRGSRGVGANHSGAVPSRLLRTAKRLRELLRTVYHFPNATVPAINELNFQEQGPLNFLLHGVPESEYALHSGSGFAVAAPGLLFDAKPTPGYFVQLPVADTARTLVMHVCGFLYAIARRRPEHGPMVFLRAADRAAMNFSSAAAMAVEPCCVYRNSLHEFTSEAVVPNRASVGLPQPEPSDLQTKIAELRPKWNTKSKRWQNDFGAGHAMNRSRICLLFRDLKC